MEPAGTRGGLNLAACGPDEASEASDPGEEAQVPRPSSCSALTSCAPLSGAEERGRLSELMLEFRLVVPDASAVVGSVGPPPISSAGAAAAIDTVESVKSDRGTAGKSGRAGEESEEWREEEFADSVGSWGVTRQSEWVEARPGVYLSLISCASPDPGSSSFWFWCVASRQASQLSDCGACMSGAAGHRCHQGQMRVDLRPVALVWNRCSQPMRAVLEGTGRFRLDKGDTDRKDHERVMADGLESGDIDGKSCNVRSAYRLAGPMAAIQPGGRIAVCQQPFVDYDLALTAAGVARGSAKGTRPFLVSVPSELMSRRSHSRWLPLHSQALLDSVLCPLVVVASRLVDAHWPSLSLRVYPGLSVRNHLSVPLSLRAVFSRPPNDGTEPSAQVGDEPRQVGQQRQRARVANASNASALTAEQNEDPEAPLLRGGGSWGDQSMLKDSFVSLVERVIRAPAESRHSAWEIFDDDGYPIPFLLPEVSLEIGLDSVQEDDGDSGSDVSVTRAGVDGDRGGDVMRRVGSRRAAGGSSIMRTRSLEVKLDGALRELVLIPWERAQDVSSPRPSHREGAVLPAFVTLEREAVLGGVELIRLEVHPRVVVHNATNLPVSLSLLGAQATANDRSDAGGGSADAVPMCRVHLTPEGRGSSMNLLAVPESRATPGGSGAHGRRASEDGEGAVGSGEGDSATDTRRASHGGLRGKLSWLLNHASYSASPPLPAGFSADVEVAFGWDGVEQASAVSTLAGGVSVGGKVTPARSATSDGETREVGGTAWSSQGGQINNRGVLSLLESFGGAPLRCEPSSITIADGGRRAVRVCVAVDQVNSGTETSPTRHVLLYKDPQPGVTVCNRSAGPVAVLFDCGSLVEVGPGDTVEHSWSEAGARDRNSVGSAARSSSRPPPTTPKSRRGRESSEGRPRAASEASSNLSTTMPSAPESPAAKHGGVGGTPRRCNSRASRGPGDSPAGTRKPRPPGTLFGTSDVTLQHWFQCKGGSRTDPFLSWSDPIWVARGVQVVRFDKQSGGADEEGWESPPEGGRDDAFGAGPVREVQVHVMERAGGFVMSFAEGGFESAVADQEAVETGGDIAAESR